MTSACHDGEASGPEGRRRQWGRSGRADCSVEGEEALASNGGGSWEDGRRCQTPRGRPAARTAQEDEPGPDCDGGGGGGADVGWRQDLGMVAVGYRDDGGGVDDDRSADDEATKRLCVRKSRCGYIPSLASGGSFTWF
jgi:hypothetical protein